MKIVLTSLTLVCTAVGVCAQNPDYKTEIPINPKPGNSTSTTKPLSLITPDIEAYHLGNVITLTFNRELGVADIVITNLSTGDMWFDTISGTGSMLIPISGDLGVYEINIYTNSVDYVGYFELQ